MMPFSVVRTWGLGVAGWCILALGIYCGWKAYDEFRTQREVVVRERVGWEPANANDVPNQVSRERNVAKPSYAWAYLSACVGLVSFSFGGFMPVHWLLGNATGPERERATPASEQWVERPDGSRLFVQIYGQDDRPTLLLTHGWSLNRSAWDYVIGKLSERCRVVVWDLPGLGKSKAANDGDQRIEKMADDLLAVLKATSTGLPIVLVGHSIGGMITQTFCRLHPEQLSANVQGLALVHTTSINPIRTNVAASLATALEWPLITPLNYLMIALAPLAWLSNWQSYLNGSLHICTRITTFAGKQTWQQLDHAALLAALPWPATLARGNLAMQTFNEEHTLSQIGVPVLVLSGEHDRMTLPSASQHIEDLLPADRPFQVASGHLGMWECPDRFAQAVTEFAEQVAKVGKHKSEARTQPPKQVAANEPQR